MIGPKPVRLSPAMQRSADADAYELVTLRDADTCQRCRRDCGPIARDHRKNRSQQGPTIVSNLQLLGLTCHVWTTEHPRLALEEGWAVPSYGVPAEWPARRWVKHPLGYLELCWVTYGDDGSVTEITEAEAFARMGRTP